MFSMWRRKVQPPVPPSVDIDSDQRWLVRARGSGELFDAVIGEVSGTGKWFRWKPDYAGQYNPWRSPDEYDWLEQLI